MAYIMTLKEALDARRVKKNEYLQVKYPDGKKTLWRLDNSLEGLMMWGPTTEKKLTLAGKEGYENGLVWADSLVKEEYALPKTFTKVQVCGLPEQDYEFHSYAQLEAVRKEAKEIYLQHPDDAKLNYFLASRCIVVRNNHQYFCVFRVYEGNVYARDLCDSDGNVSSASFAVRAAAIPEMTIRLDLRNCNGTKKKPWICLGT